MTRRNVWAMLIGFVAVIGLTVAGLFIFGGAKSLTPQEKAVDDALAAVIDPSHYDETMEFLESSTIKELGDSIPQEQLDAGTLSFTELFGYASEEVRTELLEEARAINDFHSFVDVEELSTSQQLALEVWALSLSPTLTVVNTDYDFSGAVTEAGHFERSKVSGDGDKAILTQLLPEEFELVSRGDGQWKIPGEVLLNHWETQL